MNYYFNCGGDGLSSRVKNFAWIPPVIQEHFESTKMHLFWLKTPQLGCDYLDLFENPYNFTFSYDRYTDKNPQHIRLKIQRSIKSFPLYQKTLIPNSDMRKSAIKLKNKYSIDKNVIGIHFRFATELLQGFDVNSFFESPESYVHTFPSIDHNIYFYKNLKMIEDSEILNNRRVLFFSDNQIACDYFLSRFKNFFTVPELQSNVWWRKRSKDLVQNFLISSLLLSWTNYRDDFKFIPFRDSGNLPRMLNNDL